MGTTAIISDYFRNVPEKSYGVRHFRFCSNSPALLKKIHWKQEELLALGGRCAAKTENTAKLAKTRNYFVENFQKEPPDEGSPHAKSGGSEHGIDEVMAKKIFPRTPVQDS